MSVFPKIMILFTVNGSEDIDVLPNGLAIFSSVSFYCSNMISKIVGVLNDHPAPQFAPPTLPQSVTFTFP
jgi:hypothetical protein